MYADLEAAYGPNFAHSDIRLYIKRRQLNERKRRPYKRGGFPLDDSLPKEGTFGKLGSQFQAAVREWFDGGAI